MTERPILFRGAMVRAILDDTKTQTRRVCKPAEVHCLSVVVEVPDPKERGQVYNGSHFGDEEGGVRFASPYGGVGDRLWVREAWQVARETLDYETGGEYDVWEWPDELGDPRQYLKGDARMGTKAGLFYAADGEDKNPGAFYNLIGLDNKTILRPKEIKWRPSIHMPRWASRITLEITGVRVERLQDISEADARAEGATPIPDPCDHTRLACADIGCAGPRPYTEGFRSLWQSINGPGSWDANPWVWAVEFKRVKP